MNDGGKKERNKKKERQSESKELGEEQLHYEYD